MLLVMGLTGATLVGMAYAENKGLNVDSDIFQIIMGVGVAIALFYIFGQVPMF